MPAIDIIMLMIEPALFQVSDGGKGVLREGSQIRLGGSQEEGKTKNTALRLPQAPGRFWAQGKLGVGSEKSRRLPLPLSCLIHNCFSAWGHRVALGSGTICSFTLFSISTSNWQNSLSSALSWVCPLPICPSVSLFVHISYSEEISRTHNNNLCNPFHIWTKLARLKNLSASKSNIKILKSCSRTLHLQTSGSSWLPHMPL